jgi:hypothetical protein
VENGMVCAIGGITGPWEAGAAKRSLRDPPPLVAAKDHAHAFELKNIAGRFTAHGFDRVLITEIETALGGVEGVRFPGIILAKGRVDAALRGNRMAADGMHFGENRNVEHGCRCQCRTHSCQPCSNDKNIVDFHPRLIRQFLYEHRWGKLAHRFIGIMTDRQAIRQDPLLHRRSQCKME